MQRTRGNACSLWPMISRRAVGGEGATASVYERDADLRTLEDRPRPLLALAQTPLHRLALTDVPAAGSAVQEISFLVANGGDAEADL